MRFSHVIKPVITTCLLVGSACTSGASLDPVFIGGRAVHAVGDSLLVFAMEGQPGLHVLKTTTHTISTWAANELASPIHVEMAAERWFISDVRDGQPSIAILNQGGTFERRIDLTGKTPVFHQFAVLPAGRIVVETSDARLAYVDGDSVITFALIDVGPRPSLLAGISGGVLHAVPDSHITLYNAFGGIRWRIDWPWAATAFITDIAQDARGRVHMIAGVPGTDDEGYFRVYSFVAATGEIDRWSETSPAATFVVDRFGAVTPDSLSTWAVDPPS